jgi:anti-sigma regulatory factor (Ser/Thr protein kinase)
MKLETIYSLPAIPIIRNFVVETAKFYGAESRESADLECAIEEAAEHIITNYPQDSNGIFEISCETNPEKRLLRIILGNKGLPVDAKNIPEYVIENPEDSIDGLKFFLIKKFTDNFYFVNCGQDGWQTVLEKQLLNFSEKHSPEVTAGKNPDADANPDSTKTTIALARPEDAYAITKLAYYTYRYTYAKTVFYYPEVLKESLENDNVVSFVAKNSAGEIVAHSAYIRSAACREIGEAGALMSHPAFRRSTAVMRLVKKQHQFPIDEDTGMIIIESNLVTTHTGSQRITSLMDFTPMALKISVHKRARFIAIESSAPEQRESFLYSIWLPRGMPASSTIYVPECHREMITRLIVNAKLKLALKTDTTAQPNTDSDRLKVKKNPDHSLAILQGGLNGAHACHDLKIIVKQLCIEGFTTIHLELYADKPLTPEIDAELTAAGFFFAGIVPSTPEKWMILYIYLNNQKIDFAEINLCDAIAIELRDYIQKCAANLD